MRDPTLQFIFSLLVAPLFAILGVSLDGAVASFSTSLAGWLVTLFLWSFLAVRSARYLWKSRAGAPLSATRMRLLVGITLFAVIVTVTAVVVAVLLLADGL